MENFSMKEYCELVISSLISIYIWRIHYGKYGIRCFYAVFHRFSDVSSECKYLMPIKRNWEFQIIIDCLRVCVRALCCIVLRVFWKMYFHLQLLENKREEFVLGNKISKFMSNRWSIWFYTILHPIYIVKIRNLIFQSEHTKLSEGEELEAEAVWSEEWLARSNKL